MRDRMQALWDDVVPLGVACPQADPAAVKRRVNAALNAVPSERRTYMRQKIRFAAAAAAVVGLLAGTALAAAGQWNVLDFYFEGDNTPADDYVNHETYSVSDDNYTLSVTSSVADTRSAYLLITIEAKTDEARVALMAEGLTTWTRSQSGFWRTRPQNRSPHPRETPPPRRFWPCLTESGRKRTYGRTAPAPGAWNSSLCRRIPMPSISA